MLAKKPIPLEKGLRVGVSQVTKLSAHGPSFLRWAGSKRQSLQVLKSAYPGQEWKYIEPFAGSAALFFSLSPQSAILGDLNGHLINAMRHVRDSPKALFNGLSSIDRASDVYYACREEFNNLEPRGLRAATLFIYLNRNCFNGLWRTNQSGNFNVPYGGERMAHTPPFELFDACSKALKKSKLKHQDFRKTIRQADRNSFVFADPPYFTSKERTFIEYGKKSFGSKDLEELLDELLAASDRGAHVALTYHDAVDLSRIPPSWSKIKFEVTRNVGGFSGPRKKQGEVLYLNKQLAETYS